MWPTFEKKCYKSITNDDYRKQQDILLGTLCWEGGSDDYLCYDVFHVIDPLFSINIYHGGGCRVLVLYSNSANPEFGRGKILYRANIWMVEKNVAGRRRPNNQTQSPKTSSFDKAKCLLPTKISALQFVEKCQKSRQEKICINVTQSFFRMKMFFSSLHFSFQFKLISCVV